MKECYIVLKGLSGPESSPSNVAVFENLEDAIELAKNLEDKEIKEFMGRYPEGKICWHSTNPYNSLYLRQSYTRFNANDRRDFEIGDDIIKVERIDFYEDSSNGTSAR